MICEEYKEDCSEHKIAKMLGLRQLTVGAIVKRGMK